MTQYQGKQHPSKSTRSDQQEKWLCDGRAESHFGIPDKGKFSEVTPIEAFTRKLRQRIGAEWLVRPFVTFVAFCEKTLKIKIWLQKGAKEAKGKTIRKLAAIQGPWEGWFLDD